MLVTTSMANFLLGVLAGVSAQAGSDDTLDIPGPAKFHTIHLGVKVLENDLTPSIQGYQLAYDLTSYCNANITIVPVGNSSSHGDAGAVFYTINTTAGVTGFLDSETGNAALTIEGFSFPFDSFPQIGFVRATCEDTNVSTPGFSTVNETTGARTHLHIPGGAWMACKAQYLRSIFAGLTNVEGDEVLLLYKNETDALLPTCARIELWPICDDIVPGSDEWDEWDKSSCFDHSLRSPDNTSTPSSIPSSAPTEQPDSTIERPNSENSGVYHTDGMSIITVVAFIAAAFALF